MKKFFSLVLALVMALSLTTVAWGATVTDETGLKDALLAGGEITVSGTIEVTDTLNVTKSTTITGGTLKRAADFAHLFKVTGTDVVLTLDGVTIDGNGANYTAAGSAIWVSSGASVVVKNSTITNHSTTYYPSAIFAPDSSWDPVPAKDVKLINTVVSENETTGAMSAVTVNNLSGTFVFDAASKVLNNTAVEGGGIEIHKSEASIAGLIQGNKATATDGNGAGLYVLLGTDETVTIESTAVITGNTAGGAGGGVYVNGEKDATARGKVVMNGGTISGNTAKDVDFTDDDLKDMGGDDVYVARGNMEINGGTVGGEILVSKANASYAGGELTINGGTFGGEIITPATADYSDVAVTGGTFSEDVTEYLAENVVSDGNGTYTTIPSSFTRYTLWDSQVAATKTGTDYISTNMQLPVAEKAVAPTATNIAGSVAYYVVDGDLYIAGTDSDCDIYYTVKGKTTPVMYLKQIGSEDYIAVATKFTNFGKGCGQVDLTPAANTEYYYFKDLTGNEYLYAENTAATAFATSATFLMVNGEMKPVIATNLYAEVEHTWTFTYNAKGVAVSAKCEDCGKTATVYATYAAIPTGADYIREGAYFLVINAPATTGTKVESAQTFDAGIAMYVGMSVMAAAGSAVVIGKKKA